MAHSCSLCDKNVTYQYNGDEKYTVIQDFFEMLGKYICVDCVKKIIERFTIKKRLGRKKIREIIEICRPSFTVGRKI